MNEFRMAANNGGKRKAKASRDMILPAAAFT